VSSPRWKNRHFSEPTPCAITMTDSTRTEINSSAMRAFALLVSGIVSVGR